MHFARPIFSRPALAIGQRRFGRGPMWITHAPPAQPAISDDLRLFATTFAGGFLFVSVLLA